MATQFVTLKSSDPDYSRYLWGDFSEQGQQFRAIPIKSYNLGTAEESVTFEIKNKNEINLPSWPRFLSATVKLRSYILIMLPLFFILAKHAVDDRFDIVSVISASTALLLLYAGFNIRNDVADHISGYDRVNLDSTKKPIRLGWISAKRAKMISNILIGSAAIVSIPSLLLNLKIFLVLGIVLVLSLAARFVKNNSYKNRHFGEFVLLLVSGPALLSGLQLATGSDLDSETVTFGVLWGLLVLFLVQINNFSHIMTSSQHQIKNTMTKLGFDHAQKFLVIMWTGILILWLYYEYDFHPNILSWIGIALVFAVSLMFLKNIIHIKSPMGSGLKKAKNSAQKLFLLMCFIIFLQSLDQWLQVLP
jgi:1,4-dihydroxy-2-naphthoate octaprenyltransferase